MLHSVHPARVFTWVSREIGDPTSRQAAGRLSAVLFVLCGALVSASASLPLPEGSHPLGLVLVGLVAAASGLVIWHLPWHRWPQSATLYSLVPLSLVLIDIHALVTAVDGFRYAVFFLVVFAWAGLAHPPGVSLRLSPALVVAYLAPLLLADRMTASVVSSLAYTVPVCVLVGEAVSAVASQLRKSDDALRASEARWRSLVMNASDLIVVLGADGVVQYATPAVGRLFGYPEEDAAGMQVLDLIHPDDVDFVVGRLALTLDRPGPGELIEFRVSRRDGSYVWVESIGTNLLDEPSVQGIVCNVRDITERKLAEDVLIQQAHTDFLTGLPNRLSLLDAISKRDRPGERPFALLLMDLDGFKEINDALGHETGDRVLREVARRLPNAVPSNSLVTRLGGDEFAILVDAASAADAEGWAARLCQLVDAPVAVDQMTLRLGASVGIAWSGDVAELGALLRHADAAMYRAKAAHGGWAVHRPGDDSASTARLALVNDLRDAIDSRAIDVHYQPQIDLRTGRVLQVEALARWERDGVFIAPPTFISLAENTGMIGPLTEIILRKALGQVRRWAAAGLELSVAVNVSPTSLADPVFPQLVDAALREADVPSSALTLEVTETALAEDVDALVSALRRLRALGVRLSIDDFGTGYSAMAYLKRLPIHELKIDRSFIVDMETDSRDRPIAQAIIDLAHSLGLTVVGEGVETAELAKALNDLGCDAAQGYWLSRPCEAGDLTAWLLERCVRIVAMPARVAASA